MLLSAQVVDRTVDQGTDMIMIVDDGNGWQMLFNRLTIAVAHINGHGLKSR